MDKKLETISNLFEGSEVYENIVRLKMRAQDGKFREEVKYYGIESR